MDYFKTQYERFYEGEDYYWGLEPADFLDKLIEMTADRKKPLRALDIGCGEGKDAVYMARCGFEVTAFDITESGIRKTKRLAEAQGVSVNAFTDDINDFDLDGTFDVVYSTGTIQYLRESEKASFFRKIERLTAPGGLAYFNVFVEKPFLPLPPDWDREEKMWRTGELFSYFANWKLHKIDEVIFDDDSNGTPHQHCMDTLLAEKP